MDKVIFEKIVKMGLISNVTVTADTFETVDDLLSSGLITKIGAKEYIYKTIVPNADKSTIVEDIQTDEPVIVEAPVAEPTVPEVPVEDNTVVEDVDTNVETVPEPKKTTAKKTTAKKAETTDVVE